MARNRSNILVRGFSGAVGRQLVLRTRGDQTYLANRPSINRNRVPTNDQQEVRLKFKDAVTYAKAAIQDPALKLDYAAVARPGQSAFNVAFSDAYLPPELNNLRTDAYSGDPGDKITVRATDNFFVDKVTVAIIALNGTVIEEGEATPDANGLDFTYTATQSNAVLQGSKVRVTAEDLPRNRTVLEVTL
ncbi:hypothetical protein KJS94_12390 [Flavihumibacter rivuli]|uniref:hypothetical protein n=1 Tax=Flavihumibacter rivuli TaxID=2838156 RepID=UPI001BDEC795|nr:hypothetical protein [Flavihumibacter rivuli]ULQ55441.1 hypothetical protein KJS94_12390 [Flavihumibacter rivuli]